MILRREPNSLWAIPAFFLWLISLVYRLGFALRKRFVGEPIRVAVPVLSVGNITVGGSGKTPIVALLAENFLREGDRVGIVSSGYGRQDQVSFVTSGQSVQEMDVGQTGDEVKLLSRQLPNAIFSVDKFKWRAAKMLADSGQVDVIILDDGFQHFKLARDINLVTYDASLKELQLKPFPYGLLRESHKALSRADVMIMTRVKEGSEIGARREKLQQLSPHAGLYQAGFRATEIIGRGRSHPAEFLQDKSVFLFAGIGNFTALEQEVSALSSRIDFAIEFADHQKYDRQVMDQIKQAADHHNSDLILTTLKDWVKVGNFDFGRELYYLNQVVDVYPGVEELMTDVKRRLKLVARGN